MKSHISLGITIFSAIAAITISIVQLFPQSGHLGVQEDFISLVFKMFIPAAIAAIVVLIFRITKGQIHVKIPLPGTKNSLEFTATQTQVVLWCLAYIVIKLV